MKNNQSTQTSLNNPTGEAMPEPTPLEMGVLLNDLKRVLSSKPSTTAEHLEEAQRDIERQGRITREKLAEKGKFRTLDELESI